MSQEEAHSLGPVIRLVTSLNILIRSAVVGIVLGLAACGGGGGDDAQPPPPPPPPPSAGVPTITTQPASLTLVVGAPASFTVAATGNGTITYAWRFNGSPIPSATAVTYSLSAGAAVSDAGSYDCVVTNSLNGTTASATSSAATLAVVTAPSAPALSGEVAVLPATSNHVVSTTAQPGATYEWSAVNATITAGQGTNQITYTSGHAGRATLFLTVSNIAGSKQALRNVVVATSLPIDAIFAQEVVHPGSQGVLASAPAIDNESYTWSAQNLSASVTIVGSQTSAALGYNVGSGAGTFSLSLGITDSAGRTATPARTLTVSRNVLLKDVRDPTPRSLHTATLLNDGRVLVAGGDAGVPDFGSLVPAAGTQSRILGSTEIFDSTTRTWAMVGAFTARFGHTAILLDDGRVLATGGMSGTNALRSAQIYDPGTRTWTTAALLNTGRAFHTTTLLADGRVLVVGGFDGAVAVATAEIYDPVGNTWTPAGTMGVARVLHSAVRLQNGKVLVAGGRNGPGDLASTEVFDPATNSWQATASLTTARSAQGMVLLPTGKVLMLGAISLLYDPQVDTWENSVLPVPRQPTVDGVSATDAILLADGRVLATGAYFHYNSSSVALFDPIARQWTQLSAREGSNSSATALLDGRILEVGGIGRGGEFLVASDFQSLGAASLFDPANDQRTALGSSAHAGSDAAAVVLANGRVFVSGGNISRVSTSTKATAAADLFDPTTGAWTATAPMATARAGHRATALGNGQVLVAGGNNAFIGVFATAERYDPATNTWSSAGSMSSARYKHTMTALADGRVLVAGGNSSLNACSCTTFERTADIYDPATNSWTAAAQLLTARYGHTATRLGNGKILVTGGFGGVQDTLHAGGGALASAELFDPMLGTWAAVASMGVARIGHTAELLDSGLVLVAGGTDGATTLASAELYDPNSNSWTPTASLGSARQSHSAVHLPSGRIAVIGGFNSASSAVFGVPNAEVYDPLADDWVSAADMAVTRQNFVVAPLPNGAAIIVGGAPYASGVPEVYQ